MKHECTTEKCEGIVSHGQCGGTWAICTCGFRAELANEAIARSIARQHEMLANWSR